MERDEKADQRQHDDFRKAPESEWECGLTRARDLEHDLGLEPTGSFAQESSNAGPSDAEDEFLATPEPSTPESPVPPVQAYRPPRTTPFRASPDEPESERAHAGPDVNADTRQTESEKRPPEPPRPPRPPRPPVYNPPRPPGRSQKSPSIFGPFILILLGLFFLGQSLGLVDWSLWQAVMRLWPVALIVIGLDMLLGRRGPWGRAVAVILALALVGGILVNGSPQQIETPPSIAPSARFGTPTVINHPLGEATAAQIAVESSVSRLTIGASDSEDQLVHGTVVPLVNETIEEQYEVTGGTAYYRLRSAVHVPTSSREGQGTWSLYFSKAVPIRLQLATGVGESDIDLSGLRVTELDLSTGVGDVRLTLPAQGPVTGKIDGGISQIVVRVPQDRPARIKVETGLGSVSVDSAFRKDGNYFITENFREGEDAIDLVVSGGIGQVILEIVY